MSRIPIFLIYLKQILLKKYLFQDFIVPLHRLSSFIGMIFQDIVGKTKAFAIISRLAKSVGNSNWNNKHGNNM